MSFAETYRAILMVCLSEGAEETNARTGSRIKMMPAGASLRVNLSHAILPTCGLRRTRPHVAAAEAAWCFLGHDHCDWLRKYTKTWDQFCDAQDCVECDGSGVRIDDQWTNKSECINCAGSGKTYWLEQAYGNRWRNAFGVDQLAVGLERLKNDPSDRRVWISGWDPASDILDDGQKTVPCPVGFTLSVCGGYLNSSLMIRSSDLYHGLPGDVMRHSLVVAACAATLDVQPGIVRVNLAHPHLYERQWDVARTMVRQEIVAPDMPLPAWTVDQIVRDPDAYVAQVHANELDGLNWPAFDPKSEVVK